MNEEKKSLETSSVHPLLLLLLVTCTRLVDTILIKAKWFNYYRAASYLCSSSSPPIIFFLSKAYLIFNSLIHSIPVAFLGLISYARNNIKYFINVYADIWNKIFDNQVSTERVKHINLPR